MENYRIEFINTDDSSLKKIQNLLRLVFDARAAKFSLDYLRWQYVGNPVGTIVGFNAYADDELVAHYATMPIYMLIKGKKTKGLLSLNTATHPQHRGKRLFSILAERTYEYALENGYKFVIGVSNANSTRGFIKNLKFKLIGSLTFKVGVGKIIYPEGGYMFVRYWNKALMDWRLKNPSMRYYKKGNRIVSPIAVGFKKIVCHNGAELSLLPKLYCRPFNLYIGYGADLDNGHYFNLPKLVKHSPFNLIFRDLTNGTLPEVTRENILFELMDFDVA